MANKSAVIVSRTLHGGPPIQQEFPEAASQTFKKGEAVYLDGYGSVAEFTLGVDAGGQRWLGFAAEDGHNDSTAGNSKCAVYLAWGNVFEMNVTANGADQATAITQVGTLYPLHHNTTDSISQVDISDTAGTLDSLRVMKVDSRAAAGETNGRVEVMVIDSAVQIAGN